MPDVEVMFVEEVGGSSAASAPKGAREIGIVGVEAAASNPIFHATSKRMHSTPRRRTRQWARMQRVVRRCATYMRDEGSGRQVAEPLKLG